MKTLLIETPAGGGIRISSLLSEAGHEVVRCHEPGAGPFPCSEVERPGTCPLLGPDGADVVLVARSATDSVPTAAEAGVGCAVRAGIPVAVLGDPVTNPFRDWTTSYAGDDPVEACALAMRSRAGEVAAPIRAEVERFLAAAGAPTAGTDVLVERHGDRTHITVTVPVQEQRSHDAIATHVLSRFRDAGHEQRVVDVAVRATD